MLNCAQCGHIVHETAPACPQCGTPPRAARWDIGKIIKIAAALVGAYVAVCVLLGIVGVIPTQPTKKEPVAAASPAATATPATPPSNDTLRAWEVWCTNPAQAPSDAELDEGGDGIIHPRPGGLNAEEQRQLHQHAINDGKGKLFRLYFDRGVQELEVRGGYSFEDATRLFLQAVIDAEDGKFKCGH